MSRRTRRQRNRDSVLRDAGDAYARGRFPDAIALCLDAMETQPNSAELLELGARAAVQAAELAHAQAFLERLIILRPQDLGATLTLAGVYQAAEEFEKAEKAYLQVIQADPNVAEAENGLGCVYDALNRPEEATTSYRRALELDPDHNGARRNLIGALNRLRRLEEEELELRQLLARNPNDHPGRVRLATVLQDQGHLDQAESQLRRILEDDSEHATAHVMLGVLMFLNNRLADGWAHYRWRRHQEDHPVRPYPQKEWSGEPLDGESILVWGEQGVGDEVMFASMIGDLAATGAEIILECDKRLQPLFQRSFPDIDCIAKQDPPAAAHLSGDIDFQVSSCNLGPVLRPGFEAFPAASAYLSADDDLRRSLRGAYRGSSGDRLIGIAWASANPVIGDEKSAELATFAPLFDIPGVRFVDLQYGDTKLERQKFEDRFGHALVHDDRIDPLTDLDGAAAQIAAMDLIVSISNATVHFGGALGVPTWVMLPTSPMWRWFMEREDSPWYGSVRLFRQGERGDWGPVMARVRGAIEAWHNGVGIP